MEEKKKELDDLIRLYSSTQITYKEFNKKLIDLYSVIEEHKLNLKPFDIKAAKAGKSVCTKDGRKARIICFDRKSNNGNIIALVDDCGKEIIYSYFNDGRYYKCSESSHDLMMIPEKKEMWLNIYKGTTCPASGGYLYDTKEEAEDAANGDKTSVTIVKVCWKE